MQIKNVLKQELDRIDALKVSKRFEKVIEDFKFSKEQAPKAIIKGKKYMLFNSNDYLGLRFHDKVKQGEEEATKRYGAGPGAVRFISGTLKVHKDLEKELAKFHGREDAMIFSSAFAANMAIIHCFIKGQSRDSVVTSNVLVVSDELNHRSIIDGIRVAGLPSEQKAIFKHRNVDDLDRVLTENKGKYKRVLIITDGVFSMLGVLQDLKKMEEVIKKHQPDYEEGILSIVDDAHGIAALGTGRGTEDIFKTKCSLLVGTMGKGLGSDGGYVAGDKIYIDYLRESAATYIYSNSISPGTAGGSLAAVQLLQRAEGQELMKRLHHHIGYFKEKAKALGFVFAADSQHAIQPVLIGDPVKTAEVVEGLFNEGILVTNISYPIVPKGKDEIRVQISAAHTKKDIDEFLQKLGKVGKSIGLI